MLPIAGDEQDDLHRVAVLAHEGAPARLDLGRRRTCWARTVARRGRPRRPSRPRAGVDAELAARPRRGASAYQATVVACVRRGRRSVVCRRRHVCSPLRRSVSRQSELEARRVERDRRSARRRAAAPACRSIEPIAATPPVCSTNSQAARTFGPIEPAANSARGERVRRRAPDRPLLRRAPVRVDGVDVGDDQQHVGVRSAASSALARSLSITASTPDEPPARPAPARRCSIVGMPPPPAQITTAAVLEQPPDRLDPEDPLRQRRGDDAAEAVAVGLERPALLGGEPVGLVRSS